jgi:hypothetical protein
MAVAEEIPMGQTVGEETRTGDVTHTGSGVLAIRRKESLRGITCAMIRQITSYMLAEGAVHAFHGICRAGGLMTAPWRGRAMAKIGCELDAW